MHAALEHARARRRARRAPRRRRDGRAAGSAREPDTIAGTLCIHELLVRSSRRPISSSSSAGAGGRERRRERVPRASSIGLRVRDRPARRGGRRAARRPGSSGPRSMPCGAAVELAQVSPCARAGSGRRTRPCAAGQADVGRGVQRRPRRSPRLQQPVDRLDAGRAAAEASRELEQDLPVRSSPAPRLDHRRRPAARRCAPRTAANSRSTCSSASAPRRRQDHVRVARGLVHVEIDRDHEVERGRAPRRGAGRSGSRAPGCRRR